MLKDVIEIEKLIKKKIQKNNSGQSRLTHQTCDSSHKMRITAQKAKINKYRSLIFNQSNVKR
jgi:hypothetical protein